MVLSFCHDRQEMRFLAAFLLALPCLLTEIGQLQWYMYLDSAEKKQQTQKSMNTVICQKLREADIYYSYVQYTKKE